MKKTKTILTCLFLGFCSIALAQNIQVTGKVTDAVDGQRSPVLQSLYRENAPHSLPTTTVITPSHVIARLC